MEPDFPPGRCFPCGFHCRRAHLPRPAAVFTGLSGHFHQHSFKAAVVASGLLRLVSCRGDTPGPQVPSPSSLARFHVTMPGAQALSPAPFSCVPVMGERQAASFRGPQMPIGLWAWLLKQM